ncbi:integrase [Bradyrhizobium elkanii]|nr:integrase [Bradyrhizobium elkanii]
MRAGEVVRLKVKHIDSAQKIIRIEQSKGRSRARIVSDVRVPFAKVWRGDCSLLINVFANRWRGVWRRQRRRITRCGRTTRAGARRSGTAGDRLRSL